METKPDKVALGRRVAARRIKVGFESQGALADVVGMRQQGIGAIEEGKVERPRKLKELAEALQTTQDWILWGTGEEDHDAELGKPAITPSLTRKPSDPQQPKASREPSSVAWPTVQPEFPNRQDMPRDVEVQGAVQGGDDGAMIMNGEVVEYVRRPPGLMGVKDAYALYVVNDSMSRKYEAGDLIYISKSRPARAGDYVVLEMHSRDEGEPGEGYVKLLKSITPTRIMVEQFNPPKEIEFDRREVKLMHRVYTTNELLGL